MTGLYKKDPAWSSRDVQWIAKTAKEEGWGNQDAYKGFMKQMGNYFMEKDEAAAEVLRKRVMIDVGKDDFDFDFDLDSD